MPPQAATPGGLARLVADLDVGSDGSRVPRAPGAAAPQALGPVRLFPANPARSAAGAASAPAAPAPAPAPQGTLMQEPAAALLRLSLLACNASPCELAGALSLVTRQPGGSLCTGLH